VCVCVCVCGLEWWSVAAVSLLVSIVDGDECHSATPTSPGG